MYQGDKGMASKKETVVLWDQLIDASSGVVYEIMRTHLPRTMYLKEINFTASDDKLKIQILLNTDILKSSKDLPFMACLDTAVAKTLFIRSPNDPHEWRPNIKLKKNIWIYVFITNRSQYAQDVYSSMILTDEKY